MKKLMKGNDAIVYGALLGGSSHFFGYPITPASEIAHTAALYYAKSGRTFLQAESEVAAINMLLGAGATGARSMTASSGPGIALMSEGLSYLAGSEIPCVVIDVQRAGPGLGNIWPEQGDYNMVVKGGGNGNYKNIVLAPNSAQEMADCGYKSFEIAEKYRCTVIILSDAYIGQMMEPVEFQPIIKQNYKKNWALATDKVGRKNLISSIFMNGTLMSKHNISLQKKYAKIEQEIVEYEEFFTEDAEYLTIAYGITSRIVLTSIRKMREEGIKIGLLRPKTLFPYPNKRLIELTNKQLKKVMVLELSNGQMAVDVQLAIEGKVPVIKYNWYGGIVPSVYEVIQSIKKDI